MDLQHPFRLIAFDWDGTAVANRRADARGARGPIERLIEAGVIAFIVTGTNFLNIDAQLSRAIRGPHKSNLFMSTNRGSEVWGFDAESRPVLLWSRRSKEEEDELLNEIAESVQKELVARTGLDIRIVYDRLNRRKIDLISLAEWSDPPKSQLPELERVVDQRLKNAGLAGGLREAIALAVSEAQRSPLKPRITSDVKHIEIGLTDKGDSIRWMMKELVLPRGIRTEDILIAGDEFGPITGIPGSDSLMLIPEVRDAVVASVGPEPGGVPEGVIHLGGGPARFQELLRAQAALRPLDLPAAPTRDEDWLIVEHGHNIAREHEIESLFALCNGYLGSRASLAEGSRSSTPKTFVAGVFQTYVDAPPELACTWDWANLRARVSGTPLSLEVGRPLVHARILDLQKAILFRDWHHLDPTERVTQARSLRLASLAERHLLVQSMVFTPDNYEGLVNLETALPAVPVREETWGNQRISAFHTAPSGTDVKVAFAMLTRVEAQTGEPIEPEIDVKGTLPLWRCELQVQPRTSYRFDRVVAVYTSRESADPADEAWRAIERVMTRGVTAIVDAHTRAWNERWETADFRMNEDHLAQRALRFAAYHLVGAAPLDDERVSIGARALTGASYGGHVFWDTEIYMLPFYTLTAPPVARTVLMYRFHTLPAARARAKKLGYRGALYAWESADTGDDVTPPFVRFPTGEVVRVLAGDQEHHISADVAYGVWSYWWATLDEGFMLEAGAEILAETARFWASRVILGKDGRYHIEDVIGPDEYHVSVDDNAYTNGMARWNLERGVEVTRMLKERWPSRWHALEEELGLEESELEAWQTIADRMYTGLDPRTGLIEQFRGYFGLEDIDLGAYEPRTAPMDVILGPERVQRSKVIKQADVVLLIYLLWDRFSPEVREANFLYYLPKTAHESSLSPSIHALVAARLGLGDIADRYFRQSAEIDLADNMGNAAGGVHAAALGGLWQAAVFGFAGVELRNEGPVVLPHLPRSWKAMRFSLQWRGTRLALHVEGSQADVDHRLRAARVAS